MSKNIKGNHKHLTLSDRIFIEQSLNDHMKFNAIANVLEKDPSTISKEVVRSIDVKPIPHYKGNDCSFLITALNQNSVLPTVLDYVNSAIIKSLIKYSFHITNSYL